MALSWFLRILGRIAKWVIYIGLGLTVVVAIVGFFAIRAFVYPDSDKFGTEQDEAMRAGLTLADFTGADEDFFVSMDKGLLKPVPAGGTYPDEILQVAKDLNKTSEEIRLSAIKGQNMWLNWTGGNDRFWDWFANYAFGTFDQVKIISSHPDGTYGRHNRFRYLGVINEPCYQAATAPDANGLWLDTRVEGCDENGYTSDPFDNPDKYKGAMVDARGDTVPVGSHYGGSSGVLGLRLFPNPDFDAAAKAAWDPERYYNDPDYYNDADLVRPVRVGMSCAFCHVGPDPLNPPENVEAPKWGELASRAC